MTRHHLQLPMSFDMCTESLFPKLRGLAQEENGYQIENSIEGKVLRLGVIDNDSVEVFDAGRSLPRGSEVWTSLG